MFDLFVTYNGQTCTINYVWYDRTADIVYTNSNGEEVKERVGLEKLEGYYYSLVDWESVAFECKVQSFDEWDDFEFYDFEFQTKRICLSYNRVTDHWGGFVLFIDENDEWTKEMELPFEDVMRLVPMIPSDDVSPREHESLFIVSERWDQYLCLEQEIFSKVGDALEFALKKVGDYHNSYFNIVESESRHDWYMWENTDEGVSIRIDKVQKDVRV